MNTNQKIISYEQVPGRYGQVRLFPLFLANELMTKLEEWFVNYKYYEFAIRNVTESDFSKYQMPIEYIYSYRIRDRSYSDVSNSVLTLIRQSQFQELCRIIIYHLEVAYEIKKVLTTESAGNSICDYQNKINNFTKSYHSIPFPEKCKEFLDGESENTGLENLKAINKARNCYEHRSGILGIKDCNVSRMLIINNSYPAFRNCETGNIRFLKEESFSGNTDTFELIHDLTKFNLGERIDLNFEDTYKIIWTTVSAFKGIIDYLYRIKNVGTEQGQILIQFRDA